MSERKEVGVETSHRELSKDVYRSVCGTVGTGTFLVVEQSSLETAPGVSCVIDTVVLCVRYVAHPVNVDV